MFKISVLICAVVILSGCAKVSHLDQLLTLKGLADEQTQMGEQVDAQDAKFEMMMDEQKAGTLDQYLNKNKISREFGDPIYVKQIKEEGRSMDVWMYRYAGRFFGSEKIYLYFDADDNLVRSEYIEGSDGKIR